MGDVTSLRRTEEQLRAAEAKYRNLVKSFPPSSTSPSSAWTDGSYVSPQVQDILGYTPDEWMSDPKVWQDRLHPEDRSRVLDEELVVLRSVRLRTQYRIRARDGRLVWIQEEADAVLDEQGKATLLQGIMYDVSEQKMAELMLQRALLKEQETADELRALDELKNSFLQAVSHDLRTPLTTILGNAATLQRLEGTLSPEDARDLLSRIETNARRLHRILTDLLDVDRLSKGMVEPQRQWVDVPRLIDRVLRECGRTNSVQVQADPVSALVDAAQVDRILDNLVMNALRHTPRTPPCGSEPLPSTKACSWSWRTRVRGFLPSFARPSSNRSAGAICRTRTRPASASGCRWLHCSPSWREVERGWRNGRGAAPPSGCFFPSPFGRRSGPRSAGRSARKQLQMFPSNSSKRGRYSLDEVTRLEVVSAGGRRRRACLLFPASDHQGGPFFNVLGASSVVAIVVGTRLHRPGHRLPGICSRRARPSSSWATSSPITIRSSSTPDIPFPSVGDLFYLSVYPCFIAGILVLVKHRTPRRQGRA